MKRLLKSSKPDVSVIIVNYNTGNLLLNCIRSVLRTTCDMNIEIIVVDNASEDASFEKVKKTLHAKNITLEANSKNLGFAKAVNYGIKVSSGKYKLLLNPDTIVKPEAIKLLWEFAKKRKDVGVVGARLLDPDGSVQPSVMHFPTLTRAIQEFWFGKKVYSKYAPQESYPIPVDAVVGAAFLVTPYAIEKVGLLDERYFMYFEDLDYCRRVWKAGLKVYYLPQAQIIHYHGVSGRKLAPKSMQWKRLVPSSKIYHGLLKHYLLTLIILFGQKVLRKIA